MADIFVPDFIEETKAGIFARHPSRATLPVLSAPTTPERATATNRVRQHLVTVACSNLKDRAFAFDSSVLHPDMAEGIERLARLVALYPDSPLTLFGHADPEGPARNGRHVQQVPERAARTRGVRAAAAPDRNLGAAPFGCRRASARRRATTGDSGACSSCSMRWSSTPGTSTASRTSSPTTRWLTSSARPRNPPRPGAERRADPGTALPRIHGLPLSGRSSPPRAEVQARAGTVSQRREGKDRGPW